jgi:hypothetical protein
MESRDLIDAIQRCFDTHSMLPEATESVGPSALPEADELRSAISDRGGRIDDEFLHDYSYAWPLLTKRALLTFLPKMIVNSLVSPGSDVTEHVIAVLGYISNDEDLLRLLSSDQISALIAVCQHVADDPDEGTIGREKATWAAGNLSRTLGEY